MDKADLLRIQKNREDQWEPHIGGRRRVATATMQRVRD
jgi:hypothetical protein